MTTSHVYFSEQITQPLISELSLDVFSELIKVYLAESEQHIAQLKQQVEQQGDVEQITRLAHSIKSSSKSYGAEAVAEIAWQMEQDARQKYLDNMPSLIHRLEHTFKLTHNYAQQTWLS